ADDNRLTGSRLDRGVQGKGGRRALDSGDRDRRCRRVAPTRLPGLGARASAYLRAALVALAAPLARRGWVSRLGDLVRIRGLGAARTLRCAAEAPVEAPETPRTTDHGRLLRRATPPATRTAARATRRRRSQWGA